jgi:hypothetical protein
LISPPYSRGPGHPEGYPGPGCTLYGALASLRALAAEVKRILLRLLARLFVDDHLAYRHPAIVAGVGMVLVDVEIMISGRWVHMRCARLLCGHEVAPSWSGSGRLRPRRAVFMPLHPEV